MEEDRLADLCRVMLAAGVKEMTGANTLSKCVEQVCRVERPSCACPWLELAKGLGELGGQSGVWQVKCGDDTLQPAYKGLAPREGLMRGYMVIEYK